MLKILLGVGLGFLLFTNQEARQITADLLRSTANAIAPEQDGKTFQDRVKDAVVENSYGGRLRHGRRPVPRARTESVHGMAPPRLSAVVRGRLKRSEQDRQDDW